MAVVALTFRKTNKTKTKLISWPALANGDVGAAANLSIYPNKTLHVYGTFGAGGSVTLRGSNKAAPDPTVAADWFTMSDWVGAVTRTAAGGSLMRDQPLWLSPIVTAGDGTTALTLDLVAQDSA